MREWYHADDDPFHGEFACTEEEFDHALSPDQIEELEAQRKSSDSGTALKKGEAVYMPALSVTMSNFFSREYNDVQLGDYRLTWWEDNSIVPKHPFVLINPVAWAQGSGVADKVTDKMGIDPWDGDHFVFVDSGGFQIKSFDDAMMVRNKDLHSFKHRRIHPEKLLEWQVNNGTAGAVLDIPPFFADTTETTIEATREDNYEDWYNQAFVHGLEESKEIAQMMYHKQLELGATDYKMYGVVHGIPKVDREDPFQAWREWYEGMQDSGEFHGMAFGITSTDPGKTALVLAFANEYVEEKSIHLLGTSSLVHRCLLEYWMLLNPEKTATCDSTGFTVGGKYRQMLNPLKPGSEMIVSNRDTNITPIQTPWWPCPCIVCRRAKDTTHDTWLLEEDTTERSTVINMHNLLELLRRHRMIQNLVYSHGIDCVQDYDPETDRKGSQLWKILRGIFSKNQVDQIFYGFEFMKLTDEIGIEAATKFYDIGNRFEPGPNGLTLDRSRSKSYMEW